MEVSAGPSGAGTSPPRGSGGGAGPRAGGPAGIPGLPQEFNVFLQNAGGAGPGGMLMGHGPPLPFPPMEGMDMEKLHQALTAKGRDERGAGGSGRLPSFGMSRPPAPASSTSSHSSRSRSPSPTHNSMHQSPHQKPLTIQPHYPTSRPDSNNTSPHNHHNSAQHHSATLDLSQRNNLPQNLTVFKQETGSSSATLGGSGSTGGGSRGGSPPPAPSPHSTSSSFLPHMMPSPLPAMSLPSNTLASTLPGTSTIAQAAALAMQHQMNAVAAAGMAGPGVNMGAGASDPMSLYSMWGMMQMKNSVAAQQAILPQAMNMQEHHESSSSAIARAVAISHQSQRRPRSEKKPIPSELKDGKYFERRKRNNTAAKKSRDCRKSREDEIAIRASFLEKENAILRAQVATLREEANSLRQLLLQKRTRTS